MYTDIQHCDFELGQRVFTVQYSKFQKKAKFEDYGKFFHGITYIIDKSNLRLKECRNWLV